MRLPSGRSRIAEPPRLPTPVFPFLPPSDDVKLSPLLPPKQMSQSPRRWLRLPGHAHGPNGHEHGRKKKDLSNEDRPAPTISRAETPPAPIKTGWSRFFHHGHPHGPQGQHGGRPSGDPGDVSYEDDHDLDDESHEGHTHMVEVGADGEVQGPGFLTKCPCCAQLFKVVDASWKMFPIGFLFGLGFDTASEVGLLALAALAPREHIPVIYVMLLPMVFSVGMALLDTADGILMLWAYGWAEFDPMKKLCFNLYLTAASAFIAIGVGVIEVLGCLQQELQLSGGIWYYVGVINANFQDVGIGIIVFFVASSVCAVMGFKCCYDDSREATG